MIELWNKSKGLGFQALVKVLHVGFKSMIGNPVDVIRFETNLVFGRLPELVIPTIDVVPASFRTLSQKMIKNYCLKVYKSSPGTPDTDFEKQLPLKIKFLNPLDQLSASKVFYYIHGGGFFFGQPENFFDPLSDLARMADAQIAAIEYRKIPEHSVFACFEDIFAGYLYLTGNTRQGGRGLKPADIVIGGDSAGGGLSAMIMHFLRNTYQQQPSGAVVWSPNFDLTSSQPSELIMGDRCILPGPLKKPIIDKNIKIDSGFWAMPYLGADEPTRRRMAEEGSVFGPKGITYWPLLSTMLDPDLAGLAPMLMMSGETDTFRDSGIVYARRKFKQNSAFSGLIPPMTVQIYSEQPHDFPIVPGSPFGKLTVERAANFIKLAHSPPSSLPQGYTIQDSITSSRFGKVPTLSTDHFEAYFQSENSLPQPFQPRWQENVYPVWDWHGTNYFVNWTLLI